MTSRKIGSSDVAGVTRVCNNLQILFASIPQFSDFGFLREKMPNRCVAAGCPNVPDPSKSIGLHKYPEDNDSERKRRRLWIAFVRNGLPQIHHAFAHSILKCVDRAI